MLDYEIQRQTLTVRLRDELDHRAATLLRGELDELLRDAGIRRLVFDLRKLNFMDSSGIGIILGRYRIMNRRGGAVCVRGVGRQVDRMFQMAGLYQLVSKLS